MFGTNVETIASQVLPEAQQAAAPGGHAHAVRPDERQPVLGVDGGRGDLHRRGPGPLRARARRRAACSPRRCSSSAWTASGRATRAIRASPGYGYALAQFGPMYGHTGELPGYNSFMGHDPVRQTTVVTWTNLNAAPDGRAPAIELARTIIGELAGAGG